MAKIPTTIITIEATIAVTGLLIKVSAIIAKSSYKFYVTKAMQLGTCCGCSLLFSGLRLACMING
jgi:hypothetical protein